jgi:hypothetical protein
MDLRSYWFLSKKCDFYCVFIKFPLITLQNMFVFIHFMHIYNGKGIVKRAALSY